MASFIKDFINVTTKPNVTESTTATTTTTTMPSLYIGLASISVVAIAIGVTDMVLAADMAPDGSSLTCGEDYQTYLWARGGLLFGWLLICGGVAAITASVLSGGFHWSMCIFGVIAVLYVLALCGVGIWGLIITYRPDGSECMNSHDYSERMTTLWINITCWVGGIVNVLGMLPFTSVIEKNEK